MKKLRITKKHLANFASVLIMIPFLVAACSQSPSTGNTSGDSGNEPNVDVTVSVDATDITDEEQLEEAARAEGGEVMIYTSITIDDLEVILSEFKKAYPFTDPTYYRASGDDVIQKSMTEAKTGQVFADVFETESFEVYRLMQAGLVQPFISSESEIYSPKAKDASGYWTVDRINPVVIGYNTELVDPADVPTTWDDLLDPKWKGKMGVEANDVELLAGMVSVWGEARTYEFWEGIAAQDPGIIDGHTELAELISAGEFVIAPNLYSYRVEKLKAEGAPIDWVRTDPVVTFSNILAMAANAPHPATAKLFINWLLSEEGQIVYRELGRVPGRPGIQPDPPSLVEGLNLVFTVPAMAEDYNTYAEKWRSILHLE